MEEGCDSRSVSVECVCVCVCGGKKDYGVLHTPM